MKLHNIQPLCVQFYNKATSRQERRAYEKLRQHYYNQFWKQACRSIDAGLEPLGDDFLRITKSGRWTIVRQSNVMLDNHLTLNLAGNKRVMQGLLAELNCPIPKTFPFQSHDLNAALDYQQSRQRTLVVKPQGGSTGQGVTVNIKTEAQLKKAIKQAALVDTNLLIEDHIAGASYRLLYLHGQFIDAVRRDSPVLLGNGKDSIKALIKQDNKNRLDLNNITALSPLQIGQECRSTLARQGFKLSDIAKAGCEVEIMKVVNLNAAAQNHIVRDQVHPDIISMGSQAVQQLNIELAGVDIIAEDISLPLSIENGVINEINTTPGLHHHDLVAEQDQRVNIGALLLEHLLVYR